VGRKRKSEPVRTKQDRHGLRERLARAGAELFAERGVHATQVADIAKRAEASVGGFYRYFRDKDELYRELVQARLDQYAAALRGLGGALASTTLTARLDVMREVFRRVLAMHLEDPETFLLWHRHSGGTGEVAEVVERFVRDIEQLLIEIIDRTITVGKALDEPTRRLLVTAFFGMANTLAHRMIATGDRDIERAVELCTRIAAGGMLAHAPPEWQQALLAVYQRELDASGPAPDVQSRARCQQE